MAYAILGADLKPQKSAMYKADKLIVLLPCFPKFKGKQSRQLWMVRPGSLCLADPQQSNIARCYQSWEMSHDLRGHWSQGNTNDPILWMSLGLVHELATRVLLSLSLTAFVTYEFTLQVDFRDHVTWAHTSSHGCLGSLSGSKLGQVRNALSVPLENYWEIRAVQDRLSWSSLSTADFFNFRSVMLRRTIRLSSIKMISSHINSYRIETRRDLQKFNLAMWLGTVAGWGGSWTGFGSGFPVAADAVRACDARDDIGRCFGASVPSKFPSHVLLLKLSI